MGRSRQEVVQGFSINPQVKQAAMTFDANEARGLLGEEIEQKIEAAVAAGKPIAQMASECFNEVVARAGNKPTGTWGAFYSLAADHISSREQAQPATA